LRAAIERNLHSLRARLRLDKKSAIALANKNGASESWVPL
jgi:hypothetical protein